MISIKRKYITNVSSRLSLAKNEYHYLHYEMAQWLGIIRTNYYKNKTAICILRLDTLRRLHTGFNFYGLMLFDSEPNTS